MQETRVQSLSQEDLLEKEMATHSSILAWKIPWMEEPVRTRLSDFTFTFWYEQGLDGKGGAHVLEAVNTTQASRSVCGVY